MAGKENHSKMCRSALLLSFTVLFVRLGPPYITLATPWPDLCSAPPPLFVLLGTPCRSIVSAQRLCGSASLLIQNLV